MDRAKSLEVVKIMDAVTIAASGTSTSTAQFLADAGSGVVGLQFLVAGSGTVKVEAQESIDGATFVTNTTAVAASLTAGTTLDTHDAGHNSVVKFLVTETGGASTATVSIWAAIR